MGLTAPEPFSKAAVAAFPYSRRKDAAQLAVILTPAVDDDYRKSSMEVFVHGVTVRIPKRIHFTKSNDGLTGLSGNLRHMAHCLYTRSTDGHVRHNSLRQILTSRDDWSIPFVVLLSGEYIVEIVQDIATALPTFDRTAYTNFVQENRPLMSLLRARASSYWDRYYRHIYMDKTAYPGLLVLHELERWAS